MGPKKKLFCLDIKTGKDAWVKTGVIASPGQFVSLLVMNDNLFVLGDSGRAYLVAADPKECRVIASAKVCGKNWCNPAYVDGKLLTRDRARPAVPGIGKVALQNLDNPAAVPIE